MALNYREVAGFKALIKAILEEIEDSDNFDGLWKSADAFDNAYNTAEYPISYPEDENGVEYEFDGHDLGLYQTEEEGGPPEPWVSQSEYFFKLASDHERVKSLWYDGEFLRLSVLRPRFGIVEFAQ